MTPICGFTLPEIGKALKPLMPELFSDWHVKDDIALISPPLLVAPLERVLGIEDPVWGPMASKRRGTPLGPVEMTQLSNGIQLLFARREAEGWTEDRVMETLVNRRH